MMKRSREDNDDDIRFWNGYCNWKRKFLEVIQKIRIDSVEEAI